MIEEKNKFDAADLWRYVERHKPEIEKNLQNYLPLAPPQIETRFNEAVRYALFSSGKRLRPVLTLLGAELIGGEPKAIYAAAAAAEFIHTSSLIFDDLPCMDNSDERRGGASLHARFGEGLAILVAIGFLNASYSLVFVNHARMPERAIKAHAEMVECVGAAGMLGGQSLDLALAKRANSGGFSNSDFKLESIKNLKTSALMRLSLRVGAILSGGDAQSLGHLSDVANLLGDAYQLGDDLIDFEEDGEIFVGNKTFALIEGKSAVRQRLKDLTGQAKKVLIENFPASEARVCLTQFADYLAHRKA